MSPVTPVFATLRQIKATKVDKSMRWTRWTVSASTFIEIKTIEIQRKEIYGERKLE